MTRQHGIAVDTVVQLFYKQLIFSSGIDILLEKKLGGVAKERYTTTFVNPC